MTWLNGRLAVVTGASGGIGSALCRALAGQSCRLGMLCLDGRKLAALADELGKRHVPVSHHEVDLRDRRASQAAMAAVQRDLGPVDVLIHNAGVAHSTDAVAPDPDALEEMLEVNYLAGVYAAEAALPQMLARGSGHLVGICSLLALRGTPWSAGYSASKAAMASFLESLRPPLAQRGIGVTTCYLGFVDSAMTEQLPFGYQPTMISPDSAANRILKAIVRKRREAYFPCHQALIGRIVRRYPSGLFDIVQARLGRHVLEGEY